MKRYLSLFLVLAVIMVGVPAFAQSPVLSASAPGYGGDVTVSLTIEDGKLQDVTVNGNHETPGVGSRAIELLPKLMVSGNSIEVESISGATITSHAILSAAQEALTNSGQTLAAIHSVSKKELVPGVYEGEAYGKWGKGTIEGERFGSPAIILPSKVSVTVDENRIVSVEVLSCSDTPGFIEPCIERLPAEIIKNQSISVDVVTGATLTSNAILQGVTQALMAAGADISDFSKRPVKTAAQKTYDADVAIVGAGAAGTMAALTLAKEGKKVIVFEKTGKLGGTSVCSTGFAAVGSQHQIEAGNLKTVPEIFNTLMNYCLWRADASVVYNVLSNSGEMVDTLQAYWQQTDNPGITRFNVNHQACDTGKGTPKFDVLYKHFLYPAGVEVLLETQAHSLIKDGKNIAGVLATMQDGTEVTVHAKNIIVCTGGFGGNKEMLDDIIGSSHFYLNGLSSNVGDGINMCLAVGAQLSDEVEPHLAEFCANETLDYYAGYMKFINQAGFLALDPSGERFVNEEFFITEALAKGASALRRAGYAYIILTQHDLDNMIEKGLWGVLTEDTVNSLKLRARIIVPSYYTLGDEMKTALDAGEAWKADTLEDLGNAIGLNKEIFNASIKDYLNVLKTGNDPLFGKRTDLMPSLSNGPYYAVRVCSAIDGTYNGIRVNKKMQALDGNYQPIEGLYVAGQDSGGFFSYPYYEGAGWTQGYAWTSGLIAGKSILERSK